MRLKVKHGQEQTTFSDLQHCEKLCPSERRVKAFLGFCVDMDFDTQKGLFSLGVAKFPDQPNRNQLL